MRRYFVLAATVLLIAALMATPVLAGNHFKKTNAVTASNTAAYTVCPTEDCTVTGLHRHGRSTYAAHYVDDGHDYHGYCQVRYCDETGYHEHEGEYCFGAGRSTDNGYRRGGCCR